MKFKAIPIYLEYLKKVIHKAPYYDLMDILFP